MEVNSTLFDVIWCTHHLCPTTVSYGTVYSPHPLPSPPERRGWLHGYHEIFLYYSIVLPWFRNSKCNRYSLMKICLPLPTLTIMSSQLIWTVREQSFSPKLQLDCFRRSPLFSSGMIGRAKYTSARARASSPRGRFIIFLFPVSLRLSAFSWVKFFARAHEFQSLCCLRGKWKTTRSAVFFRKA